MKKLNLILVAFLCFACVQAFAQTSSLKVTSAGDVGIGTDTPTAKFEVVGDAKSQGGIFEKANGSASVSCQRIGSSAFAFGAGIQAGFTIDANYHLEFRSNTRTNVLDRKISTGTLLLRLEKLTGHAGFGVGNPVTSIHTNGSITYNGSLNNASDERLKHNISKMNYGLDEVLQLNPISYQYNGKAGIRNVEKQQIGLKAQELQKVAPALVSTFTYEEEDVESKVTKSEDYLMIEESAIKYMLINAVKEQHEIIDEQAAKIDEQADKLAKMEAELAAIKELLTGKSSKNTLTESIDGSLIEKAQLGQNTPNPFDKNTMIEYYLPKTVNSAQVAVYDNTGKMVKEINIEAMGQGQVDLQLTNMASGTYHYSLIVDGKVQDSKKMILK